MLTTESVSCMLGAEINNSVGIFMFDTEEPIEVVEVGLGPGLGTPVVKFSCKLYEEDYRGDIYTINQISVVSGGVETKIEWGAGSRQELIKNLERLTEQIRQTLDRYPRNQSKNGF